MAVRKIFIAEISRTMMYVAECARTRSNRARARESHLRHRVCNLEREMAGAKKELFLFPRTNLSRELKLFIIKDLFIIND